jgi:hypothetical protein
MCIRDRLVWWVTWNGWFWQTGSRGPHCKKKKKKKRKKMDLIGFAVKFYI